MSGLDAPSAYIQLAFMIERHFPGYVDSYFGPPELKAQSLDGDEPSFSALEDLAAFIGHSLSADPNLPPDRRTFLEAELRAMRTTIQILAGNVPNIVDEVRQLYGVTPEWVDESTFKAAHTALSGVLPGAGPLSVRVQAFRERSQVSGEVAVPIIRQVLEDFRGRAQRLFDLPSDESCEIALVKDQPWRAYNWFLGNRKSRIEFNLDHRLEVRDIPNTVAHEAYPGHHTELVIKEDRLYHGGGRLEHAIHLNNTPSSLISEGIAKNALGIIASQAEIASLLIDIYARVSLPKSDAERAPDFSEAYRRLERVTDNQVLMLYRDHAPEDEVIDYGMRYSLTTKDDEVRFLRFLKDPLSRSYTYNYTLGSDLIARFLGRAPDRLQAYRRLLSEPITPAQIRSSLQDAGTGK